MRAFFTGFDSAWSSANRGAICELLLSEDGSLRLVGEPAVVDWDAASARARREMKINLQVWAIDQPLLVNNKEGCRPVERDLARALMANFGCGAHSSNLGLSAWAEGAPIWKFMHVLQENGFVHSPMEVPGASQGRFFFECYPHPAVLGLFDLDRILKYKVEHRNSEDWQRLIGLLRSLASSELPIQNIGDFVHEGLHHNKKNEDKLDSLVSAYVAAYWWRFGVERSTAIGDLSTGYMVTPHSKRTLAALARVFRGRMNQRGTWGVVQPDATSAEPSEVKGNERQPTPRVAPGIPEMLPRCDWVYFATTAKWSGTVTRDFVAGRRVIVRSLYNAAGLLIANVQHLKSGERILLVHGGHGKPYRPLFSCTISAAEAPVRSARQSFCVFSYIDESLQDCLKEGGYTLDPVLRKFTGISISELHDLRGVTSEIPRPSGNNTIRRWDEVFGR